MHRPVRAAVPRSSGDPIAYSAANEGQPGPLPLADQGQDADRGLDPGYRLANVRPPLPEALHGGTRAGSGWELSLPEPSPSTAFSGTIAAAVTSFPCPADPAGLARDQEYSSGNDAAGGGGAAQGVRRKSTTLQALDRGQRADAPLSAPLASRGGNRSPHPRQRHANSRRIDHRAHRDASSTSPLDRPRWTAPPADREADADRVSARRLGRFGFRRCSMRFAAGVGGAEKRNP